MKVSAQYATAHFDELSTAVDAGEVVEIERPCKQTLTLVPTMDQERILKPRVLGGGVGKLRVPSEAEWAALDHELWGDRLDEHRNVADPK
jgi:hypothetical protein